LPSLAPFGGGLQVLKYGSSSLFSEKGNDMDIRINVAGATIEEIARGLAAAQAVFNKAGITAERAADARFVVEGWDDAGFPDDSYPDDEDFEFLHVWDDADRAAAAACCSEWPEDKRPETAGLELFDEETDARRAKLLAADEAYRRGLTPEQFEKEWNTRHSTWIR
jgi:hypothetical protein